MCFVSYKLFIVEVFFQFELQIGLSLLTDVQIASLQKKAV